MAAALLLPGLASLVQADEPPERQEVAVRFLSYQDGQPGFDRVAVRAPTIQWVGPLAAEWSASARGTLDAVSGASPRYHSTVSGASRMTDRRLASEWKLTWHRPNAAWTFGLDRSAENDYRSTGLSLQVRQAADDRNTEWTLAAAVGRDRIHPVNDPERDERRRTASLLAGVTRVLTPEDVAQFNLGVSHGEGSFSDPYKLVDQRPRQRTQFTARAAWNHHLGEVPAVLRSSYRFYRDDWGVQAHAVELAWAYRLSPTLRVTPQLRYATQRAARFYVGVPEDPSVGVPFPAGYASGTSRDGVPVSADQRLSGFGALTVGLAVDWQWTPDLALELAIDRYAQRGAWRLGGRGSRGLAPFRASMVQFGCTWRF